MNNPQFIITANNIARIMLMRISNTNDQGSGNEIELLVEFSEMGLFYPNDRTYRINE